MVVLTAPVVFTGCILDLTAVVDTVLLDVTNFNAGALTGEDVVVAVDTAAVVTEPKALLLINTVAFAACVVTGVVCLPDEGVATAGLGVEAAVANVFSSRPFGT